MKISSIFKSGAIIFFIFALILFLGSYSLTESEVSFRQKYNGYVKTQGTCVSRTFSKSRVDSDGFRVDYYKCTIHYTVNGNMHSIAMDSSQIKINDTVDVRYNPNNPSDATIYESNIKAIIATTLTEIVCIVLGIFMIHSYNLQMKRNKESEPKVYVKD